MSDEQSGFLHWPLGSVCQAKRCASTLLPPRDTIAVRQSRSRSCSRSRSRSPGRSSPRPGADPPQRDMQDPQVWSLSASRSRRGQQYGRGGSPVLDTVVAHADHRQRFYAAQLRRSLIGSLEGRSGEHGQQLCDDTSSMTGRSVPVPTEIGSSVTFARTATSGTDTSAHNINANVSMLTLDGHSVDRSGAPPPAGNSHFEPDREFGMSTGASVDSARPVQEHSAAWRSPDRSRSSGSGSGSSSAPHARARTPGATRTIRQRTAHSRGRGAMYRHSSADCGETHHFGLARHWPADGVTTYCTAPWPKAIKYCSRSALSRARRGQLQQRRQRHHQSESGDSRGPRHQGGAAPQPDAQQSSLHWAPPLPGGNVIEDRARSPRARCGHAEERARASIRRALTQFKPLWPEHASRIQLGQPAASGLAAEYEPESDPEPEELPLEPGAKQRKWAHERRVHKLMLIRNKKDQKERDDEARARRDQQYNKLKRYCVHCHGKMPHNFISVDLCVCDKCLKKEQKLRRQQRNAIGEQLPKKFLVSDWTTEQGGRDTLQTREVLCTES